MIDFKIFILHHPALKERKEYLLKVLNKYNFDIEWIENFPPEEVKDNYDKYTENYEKCENIYIWQIRPELCYQNYSEKISIGHLSLCLKHEYALNKQIEKNYEYVLILEDDCFIPQNFNTYLDQFYKEYLTIKDNIDIAILGTAFNLTPKDIVPEKMIYVNRYQLSRCTHAIFHNINFTKKIINRFKIRNLHIDFKFNEILTAEKAKVGWVEPSLIQNTFFKTSLG
jgi:hypothetical protein